MILVDSSAWIDYFGGAPARKRNDSTPCRASSLSSPAT